MAIGLFLFFGCFLGYRLTYFGNVETPIVLGVSVAYTTATEHHMTLLNKVFTTRTLVKIILVLTAVLAMKAASLHYDFSWATALAAE
jgi:hypothetical protein